MVRVRGKETRKWELEFLYVRGKSNLYSAIDELIERFPKSFSSPSMQLFNLLSSLTFFFRFSWLFDFRLPLPSHLRIHFKFSISAYVTEQWPCRLNLVYHISLESCMALRVLNNDRSHPRLLKIFCGNVLYFYFYHPV